MTKITVKVDGLDQVTANLNKEIQRVRGRNRLGIQKVANFIKGVAVSLAPIEFGPLRQSAFFKTKETPSGPEATIGFTAEYAGAVHEAPEKLRGEKRTGKTARGNYWDGGENKFLEKAVRRNFTTIINILSSTIGK